MGAREILLVVLPLVVTFVWSTGINSDHCSDVACASVVSKCMLTQACKCEIDRRIPECSCCRNCTQCLGTDYTRCCSCLGLCEPTNDLSLGRESQVGDIPDPFNSLFQVFNEAPDGNNMWTSHSFPIEVTLREFARRANLDKSVTVPAVYSEVDPNTEIQVNCTVMYFNQCMSVSKCSNYCSKYGAATYRYFFDGCCECVGLTCLNYGLDESRCAICSNLSEDDEPVEKVKFNEDLEENVIN